MSTIEITAAAGLKKGLALLLDADGAPTGATAGGAGGYFGEAFTGIQSVQTNIPEPQRVNHPGDDQVFAQDTLSPNELPSGTIVTGKTNQALDAVLTRTLVQTVGDGKLSVQVTNRQGDEARVAFVYYRQALDTDPESPSFGARKYQTHIVPNCKIVPLGSSPAQGAADSNNYSMAMTRVNDTPWGVALTENDNGATSAAKLLYTGDYPWMPALFMGNGTAVTFTLEYAPISVDKTDAWLLSNGSALTVSSVDTSARTLTLSAAPANNALFLVMHETDEAIV